MLSDNFRNTLQLFYLCATKSPMLTFEAIWSQVCVMGVMGLNSSIFDLLHSSLIEGCGILIYGQINLDNKGNSVWFLKTRNILDETYHMTRH